MVFDGSDFVFEGGDIVQQTLLFLAQGMQGSLGNVLVLLIRNFEIEQSHTDRATCTDAQGFLVEIRRQMRDVEGKGLFVECCLCQTRDHRAIGVNGDFGNGAFDFVG